MIAFNAKAAQGGTLTPNPSPIVPNASVTINYDGTGTNFANWTPKCFIHVWLVPKSGMTFTGNYAPAWIACDGDNDYEAIDAKYKMTHDGVPNSGKYSITIANLYTYMGVLDEDKSKVDKFGVIVRAEYPGDGNQTNDFLLAVTDPTTGLSDIEKNFVLTSDNGKIQAQFDGTADIQLCTLTGQLIRSTVVTNNFTEMVKSGIYIFRINGKAHKVVVQ